MTLTALRRTSLVAATALVLGAASTARAISLGQTAKLDGIIATRSGASMTLKTDDHGSVTVLLTENTDVDATKGRLGLIKKGAAATALIPGLKVEVKGVGDAEGRLIATKVRFTSGDLETAEAIQAGLTETGERLDATEADVAKVKADQADLTKRFGQLGDYDVRDQATVYFEVGSAAIPEEGARELARVAAAAKGLKGYLLGVEGFADASGNASVNQKLSLERSQAVVNWLAQQGGVPFVNMLAPGAMSTAAPVASNETSAGRAQNRRVVVKVLINRGIAGG
jgi:outer membrane protein OmpA-like peptidoglycan-associated protein